MITLKLILLLLSCACVARARRCANNGIRLPETQQGYPNMFCKDYEKETCCTQETDENIKKAGQVLVDGTNWDLCGKLSPGCEKYLKRETCRYECSPNLGSYVVKDKRFGERYRGIPFCAPFCDEWYEACKDDKVCAKNWMTDFKWTKSGNECKLPCKTYREIYGSGKELCNNIWSNTIVYSTDESTCIDV